MLGKKERQVGWRFILSHTQTHTLTFISKRNYIPLLYSLFCRPGNGWYLDEMLFHFFVSHFSMWMREWNRDIVLVNLNLLDVISNDVSNRKANGSLAYCCCLREYVRTYKQPNLKIKKIYAHKNYWICLHCKSHVANFLQSSFSSTILLIEDKTIIRKNIH